MSIKKIGVLMAGFGDVWIVETLARQGFDITLLSPSNTYLQTFNDYIEKVLDKKIRKWSITESEKKVIMSRIHYEQQLESLSNMDLVIESINENVEERKKTLGKLDKSIAPEISIITNLVCYQVSDLQRELNNPSRLIGVHFIRNIAEVIRGEQTSQVTYEAVCSFIQKANFEFIEVKEKPGYVFSRLALALLKESVNILEEEITTAHDLEQVMKQGFELKMGPLEYADRIGLDDIIIQMQHLYEETKDEKYAPLAGLQQLVDKGYFGTKAGKGFLTYDGQGNLVNEKREVVNV